MLKPVTQIYQEQLDNTLKQKAAEKQAERNKVKGVELEKYELWSRDILSKEIIQKLTARREAIFLACMKDCSAAAESLTIMLNLREAKTLTEIITLMQTGEYKE